MLFVAHIIDLYALPSSETEHRPNKFKLGKLLQPGLGVASERASHKLKASPGLPTRLTQTRPLQGIAFQH